MLLGGLGVGVLLALYSGSRRDPGTSTAEGRPGAERPKIFISYNQHDKPWAEWIAWQLEEEGYEVVIQAWDFLPGHHFVQEMHQAAEDCQMVVPVLSPNYLQALFTHSEWQAFFVRDPNGQRRMIVPVRVEKCDPPVRSAGDGGGRTWLWGPPRRRRLLVHPPSQPAVPQRSSRALHALTNFSLLECLTYIGTEGEAPRLGRN